MLTKGDSCENAHYKFPRFPALRRAGLLFDVAIQNGA